MNDAPPRVVPPDPYAQAGPQLEEQTENANEAEQESGMVRKESAEPAYIEPPSWAKDLRDDEYRKVRVPSARFRWVWVPLSFIFLLMGVVLGFQTALSWRAKGIAAQASEAFSLGLAAKLADETLSVRWDRTAPAVKLSQRGVLDIEEGNSHKSVDLDTPQLQTGSIIYRSSGGPVKFRLTVFPREQTSVSETISWPK